VMVLGGGDGDEVGFKGSEMRSGDRGGQVTIEESHCALSADQITRRKTSSFYSSSYHLTSFFLTESPAHISHSFMHN
jgi:hypothetical protein